MLIQMQKSDAPTISTISSSQNHYYPRVATSKVLGRKLKNAKCSPH